MKTFYINPEGYALAAARTGVPVQTASASAPAVFKQVLIAATGNASGVKHISYPLTGWKVRAGAVTGPVDIHRTIVLVHALGTVRINHLRFGRTKLSGAK